MENMGDWEQKNLICELLQGKELAKELQLHLINSSSSSSYENRDLLLQKILSSYEKALSMLKWNGFSTQRDQALQPTGAVVAAAGLSDSPCSLSGSPRSEDSDQDQLKDVSKKRKSMLRWTKQMQVCAAGIELEAPVEDGYSWRKYGQKDILGAKYPRGYYRCTHRNAQGCLATKQVQRSDEDPTLFDITYHGRHTCLQATSLNPSSSTISPEKQEPPETENHQPQQYFQEQQQSQEVFMNFKTGLKVITEDLGNRDQTLSSSFCFPSTSNINPENHCFLPYTTTTLDNNFMSGYYPSFTSPTTTSGSDYFSVSPNHHVSNNFGGIHNLHGSKSDLGEIISATTSTTTSPIVGLDFPFGQPEFDPNFTFDNPGFFS